MGDLIGPGLGDSDSLGDCTGRRRSIITKIPLSVKARVVVGGKNGLALGRPWW